MQLLMGPRYFFYSMLLHVLIILSLLALNKISVPKFAQPQILSLELIEPTIKKNPKNEERKIIVDQNRLNNEIDPLAKYLSSHSQKVVKETVAKEHGDFQNKMVNAKPMQKSIPVPVENRAKLPRDLFGSYKDALTKSLEKQQQSKGADQTGADVSRTRDYLPDQEAGMETLLSTREFIYYTYYNRIRNQLSQYWEPKIKQKIKNLFKQGRRIASTEDRVTKVLITLDSKGVLIKVQVLGESGIQDLDDVAVEAFRAAAPFPNPPRGIIEADGTVKIQWDFVIES